MMMAMTANQKPQVRNSERVATCSTVASRPSIVATRSLRDVSSGRVGSRSASRWRNTMSPAIHAPDHCLKPAIVARTAASDKPAYFSVQCSISLVRSADTVGVVMPNDPSSATWREGGVE